MYTVFLVYIKNSRNLAAMKTTKPKSKRLEWDESTIRIISAHASSKGTNFKHYVQDLVQKKAEQLTAKTK